MSAAKLLAAFIGLIVLPLHFSIVAGESAAPEDEFKDDREIRSVENFVPYDEFLKITGKDPNATIMTLAEYRALVELATARNPEKKSTVPPPIEASLMEAKYDGVAGDVSVRFDVQFKFNIAGKGWKRCDLGQLQNLGHVTLDGKPGASRV